MMNNNSRWRQTIARQLAPLYGANPHVAAVLLGGSSARGHADRFSDIELGVFWHQPPTEEERGNVVTQSGGDLLYLYPYDAGEQVWCDDLMIGRSQPELSKSGVLVEVVHYTVTYMNEVLYKVLIEYDPDEGKQNLIAATVDGLPLYNPTLIDGWRAQASEYPEGLAVAVINRHAQIDHFWRGQMWLERGQNLMMLYQSFTQIQQQLLHVLLGLNHVYYSGFKWIDHVLARLVIAPPDLAQRLQNVYLLSPKEAIDELASLVEDTYTLVESHVPQVDVKWLRQVFRYQRPLWDESPLE